MQELLAARKRLVFDEFLLFILAVQILKGKTEEAPNAFPMKPDVYKRQWYDLSISQEQDSCESAF